MRSSCLEANKEQRKPGWEDTINMVFISSRSHFVLLLAALAFAF